MRGDQQLTYDTYGDLLTLTYIGLAVANGGSTTLENALFDNVSVSSTTAPAPVITSLSATMGTIGSQITITGNNFGTSQNDGFVLLNDAPALVPCLLSSFITTGAAGTCRCFPVHLEPLPWSQVQIRTHSSGYNCNQKCYRDGVRSNSAQGFRVTVSSCLEPNPT
jgi:hypothetical protein